jgi:hypothetical protein
VKTKLSLLFLTLILCACSTSIITPQTLPTQTATRTPQPKASTKIVTEIGTPHIDQGPNGNLTEISPSSIECGYQWAYEELPDLTSRFNQAVKEFIPNSTSRAAAFGENCVSSSGNVISFLALETDFYVVASVESLDDYETFGNWIVQVMQVVGEFPPYIIAGPKSGFVEFQIEKSMTESIGFRVQISGYTDTANGITGEDLFRLFYTEP